MARADFFFYGTLRDPELRRIVLGPAARTGEAVPALVHGHRAAPVARGRYPALVTDARSTAPGVFLAGVDPVASARISVYEDEGGDYLAGRVEVEVDGRMVPAWCYLPTAALRVEAGIWVFDDWSRWHRTAMLRAAHVAMRRCRGPVVAAAMRRWRDRLSAGNSR